MQPVPEAALEGEGVPSATKLYEPGYGHREDQPHPEHDKVICRLVCAQSTLRIVLL